MRCHWRQWKVTPGGCPGVPALSLGWYFASRLVSMSMVEQEKDGWLQGKLPSAGVDTPGQDTVGCTEVAKACAFWRGGLSLVGGSVVDCVQCAVLSLVTRWVRSLITLRMLTKWSHPTRLETRIKESNIRASAEVANLHA